MCIYRFIEWLNYNSGAFMTLLTFVYAISTIILCILSCRSINIAKQLHRDVYRPVVIFDFVIKHNCFHAVIKNIGKTPAYDIKTELQPEVYKELRGKIEKISFVKNSVSFLPPEKEIVDFIAVGPDFHEQYKNETFKIFIQYKDSINKKYQEETSISLDYLWETTQIGSDDNMREIARNLSNIDTTLKKMLANKSK